MDAPALQAGSGLLEPVGGAIALASTLVMVLMIAALVGIAYRHLRGGGIEWPDDEPEDGDVSKGDADDEWKYY